MGVNKLHNYIHRNQNITKEVSLKVLAREHRKICGNQPVLLIDGLNVLEQMYPNPDHWIYGIRGSHCIEQIKLFIQKLRESDIEPVFYFDGVISDDTREVHIDRRRNEYEKIRRVFQSLTNNCLDESLFHFSPGLPSLVKYFIKCECRCKVYSSVYDTDPEIADFASNTPECFAILGNDTDFLIFDTKPLLSGKLLNMETMSTKMYVRSELTASLNLDPSQLSLLSCMAGNEVIAFDKLEYFHKLLSPQYGMRDYKLINKIARYINANKLEGSSSEIPGIAKILNIDIDLLKRGINWYNLPPEFERDDELDWCSPEILDFVRNKSFKCECPIVIYDMIRKRRYMDGKSMENSTGEDLLPSVLIYRPIRQRIYRIIFQGKPIFVKESYYSSEGDHFEQNIKPRKLDFQGEIPFLDVLWLKSGSTLSLRLKLFVSCLGVTIKAKKLMEINEKYVALCCLLNYLLNSEGVNLRRFELEAFIGQAVHPRSDDVEYISNLQVPIDNIKPRAVHLASVLQSGFAMWTYALYACGSPLSIEETMPMKYFDGKLFHYIYNRLEDSADIMEILEDNCDAIENFNTFLKLSTTEVSPLPLS